MGLMKRLLAIAFIWLGCTAAWTVLGSTIVVRTGASSYELEQQVHGLWGPEIWQAPPDPFYREMRPVVEEQTYYDDRGRERHRSVKKMVEHLERIPLTSSDVVTHLALEHRRKGLLWFPTYTVDFDGRFRVRNPTEQRRDIEVDFPLERANAVYDGFTVLRFSGPDDAQGEPIMARVENSVASWKHSLDPGEEAVFAVRYRSRGTTRWHYDPAPSGRSRTDAFSMKVTTNFEDVDFPVGSLSPTRHAVRDGTWSGEWTFETLVGDAPIGIEFPELLNPGPLASRITFFAPVGMLFFFFVVGVLAVTRGQKLHPANFFFFGTAFFAFHLLFAYLVDHLAVLPSFAISSAVSIGLVVSYARLFVGWRFALVEMGLSQLVYLVLFSFTFLWQGFTGLAITVGAIMTLFVMMQITGRANWRLARAKIEPDPLVARTI